MYNKASIYKGGGVYNLGDGASTKLPANTLRFMFSKMDYDPTVAGVGSSGTWKKVVSKFHNVWDWTKTGSTSLSSAFETNFKSEDNIVSIIAAGDLSSFTNMNSMFRDCSSLKSVCLFDTSNSTNTGSMFRDCSSLESVPNFNLSKTTSTGYMFRGCSKLKETPDFNTSLAENMSTMYAYCRNLEKVPAVATDSATNVMNMFLDCFNVKEGALDLYTQMSSQSTPPSSVSGCFTNCGSGTTTGAAELAQIPQSWGGTAPSSLNMGAPQNLTEPLSPSVIDGDDSLTK